MGIANIFKQALVKSVLPPEVRPIERVVRLDPSSSLMYTAPVKNEAEENSVVEVSLNAETKQFAPAGIICAHLEK